MNLPRLLLLTDRSQLPLGRSLVSAVADCVDAGLTHVVVRELDETPLARMALVAALTEVGATVISAHDALHGAAGVHLPSSAATVAPRDLPWGRSCHSATEVHVAAAAGAAWATLSPFAATASKPGRRPIERGEYAVAATAGIPVFALGGITPENAVDAIACGADGLAVMGAVMRAADPASVVRELLDLLEDAPW
ncbi:thiamine phosphate synthase [Nocardioides jiangxiensis]|uniref:Thiamine phosphate synthase n=1 Tax=Nocardioides jiangxiensis TaxID=3064524 RepID=A0ABT9B201_9ACTN|nr:thiamine phosphate synthase [Nocardioides sp. WY-20]MDO7868881.1 thiamine phosphate synthase [Nocardioides sp. WY-20]